MMSQHGHQLKVIGCLEKGVGEVCVKIVGGTTPLCRMKGIWEGMP